MSSVRRSARRRPLVPLWLVVSLVAVSVAFATVAGLQFLPARSAASAPHGWFSPGPGGTPRAESATLAPSPSPSPEPLAVRPAAVRLTVQGWWSWAMLDHRTGEIVGSANLGATSTTASLIKAWVAADYLRRAADRGETPSASRLRTVSIMIRDSDNDAAATLWNLVGQGATVTRLVSVCDLTDSRAVRNNWSLTRLSPRDTARLGACLADGRAAGPRWTSWLLKEMRLVRGIGDFGVRKAFPAAIARTIAVKNGWVVREDGDYHVNCLAIGDGWSIGVMARYPARLDYTYGARICQDVARQLRAP